MSKEKQKEYTLEMELAADKLPVGYPPAESRIVHWPYSGVANPHLPSPTAGTKEAGRDEFDLTHPDKWPRWLRYMDTEHGAAEIMKDGTVLWRGGTIHDGIWMGGDMLGGMWRDGIWLGGQFWADTWVTGEWRGGDFMNGVWRGGVFRKGTFHGLWLGGLWMGGEFDGYWQKTQTPPPFNSIDCGHAII